MARAKFVIFVHFHMYIRACPNYLLSTVELLITDTLKAHNLRRMDEPKCTD